MKRTWIPISQLHNYLDLKDQKFLNEIRFIGKNSSDRFVSGYCRTCQILDELIAN